MKHQKAIRMLILVILSGLFLFSAYMIFSYLGESLAQEAAFDELEEQIAAAEIPSASLPVTDTMCEESTAPSMLPSYAALYAENSDLFGWIQIDGTDLSYPVMYTPDDPEYYLRRAFDGSKSTSGVPFLDGDCLEDGGNYLIYGHNMSGGTMFALFPSYARQAFFEEHLVIRFDTLFERGEYEVMAAFYSKVYDAGEQGVFRYYEYTDLGSPERFQDYVEQVKAAALYDTDIEIQPGDQLLTLSTCSYHTKNGRFVVVAQKDQR